MKVVFEGAEDAEVGTYKGKKYKILYRGQTKFGNRTHLAFFSGEKDFWVPSENVQVSAAPSNYSSSASTGGMSPMERVYGRGRYGQLAKCKECGGWKAPGDPCGEPCD
jgi:hypothetical protein